VDIIEKRLDELKPYKNNPRKNDNAVDAVAASISTFGFKVPLVIDRDGEIVCGHTRIKAAKKLGLESVPCVVADDLTEEQIKAFRIADNAAGAVSTWDLPALDLELAEIDFDMSQFGLDILAEEAPTESKTDNEKSVDINEEYAVLVSCETEQELQRTYETLQKEGYQCRIFAL